MSSALTATERERLVRLLGMLGSSFDGERAAAGLLASRLLADRGLTWQDVIATGTRSQPASDPYRPSPWTHSAWRNEVQFCLSCRADLSTWEVGFLESLATRRQLPTGRQLEVIAQILQKLYAMNGAAAP